MQQLTWSYAAWTPEHVSRQSRVAREGAAGRRRVRPRPTARTPTSRRTRLPRPRVSQACMPGWRAGVFPALWLTWKPSTIDVIKSILGCWTLLVHLFWANLPPASVQIIIIYLSIELAKAFIDADSCCCCSNRNFEQKALEPFITPVKKTNAEIPRG